MLDRLAPRARLRRRWRLLTGLFAKQTDYGLYRLPHGYRENTNPVYDDSDQWGPVVWQPDVYPHALRTAQEHGIVTIVDVGCGDGRKLADLRSHVHVVGVDYGANLERCRAQWPDAEWVDHDLDADAPLPIPLDDSLVICSDVIEHLQHPERLLRHVTAAQMLVLSTIDRNLIHGPGHLGPPRNQAHIREWTRRELRRFLNQQGYRGSFRYTRSRERPPTKNTILFTGRHTG